MLRHLTFLGWVAALCSISAAAAAQGRILIVNANDPGEGFNDPTPALPLGGNPGTTLGEQRLLAFERAADIWEAALAPRVDVQVLAQLTPLGSSVLGSARGIEIYRDFAHAPLGGTCM